jgi:LacI family transcriptional regulator
MSVLLCDGRGDPIREQHYVHTLLSRRVDGQPARGVHRLPCRLMIRESSGAARQP